MGRTIFAESAKGWLAGTVGDEEAVDDMARRFAALVEVWERLGESQAA